MDDANLLFAIGLTVFAGMATGIGSIMSLLSKKFNPKFLAASLGFSAGVMIYVSLVEIFSKAKDSLVSEHGAQTGNIYTVVAFFTGIAVIALIDKLIPSFENPHEIKNLEAKNLNPANSKKLLRIGLFTALAIAIHNFPEGLATFMGAINDPALGISIAVAIAIHNIPEGIAVCGGIYLNKKNRKKA
ncbi:MAG TPA: ZIP family metal transporter, partial [Bacteroidales bacterium]|nr:ZIP family metal transporter [Bacteroidales bacterium]